MTFRRRYHYQMQIKDTIKRYRKDGVKHNMKFEEQKNEIVKCKFFWNGIA